MEDRRAGIDEGHDLALGAPRQAPGRVHAEIAAPADSRSTRTVGARRRSASIVASFQPAASQSRLGRAPSIQKESELSR